MRYSIIAEDSKTIIMTRYITLDTFEVNNKFKYGELLELENIITDAIRNGKKWKVSDIFEALKIEVPDKCKWWIKQNDYELVSGVVFECFNTPNKNIELLKIDWL